LLLVLGRNGGESLELGCRLAAVVFAGVLVVDVGISSSLRYALLDLIDEAEGGLLEAAQLIVYPPAKRLCSPGV